MSTKDIRFFFSKRLSQTSSALFHNSTEPAASKPRGSWAWVLYKCCAVRKDSNASMEVLASFFASKPGMSFSKLSSISSIDMGARPGAWIEARSRSAMDQQDPPWGFDRPKGWNAACAQSINARFTNHQLFFLTQHVEQAVLCNVTTNPSHGGYRTQPSLVIGVLRGFNQWTKRPTAANCPKAAMAAAA